MTADQLTNLGILIANNLGVILTLLAGFLTFLVTVYPTLRTNRIVEVASAAVHAAQQTIATPDARFASADAALAKAFPQMTPAERKLWIEAQVAFGKLAGGTATFDQLPPVAPAVDPTAALNQLWGQLEPAMEQKFAQLLASNKTAAPRQPRAASGQFTTGAAPVVVSSPTPPPAETGS